MNNDNTQHIEQFITHKGNAENLLQQILAITEDFLGYTPEEINAGHVGTMACLVEDLKELAERVGIDSEEVLNS